MRPSRWVPARFTRCSGSCAFSVPKRAALVTIISVSPMMALSGVRSSWLMLETNCDLFSLAICELSVLVLDFVEQPHVLDGDHRLVGEGRDQLDLLVGERPHFRASQCQDTDRGPLAQHRDTEHRAKATAASAPPARYIQGQPTHPGCEQPCPPTGLVRVRVPRSGSEPVRLCT